MPDGTTVVNQLTAAQMVEQYIKLRDKKDELKKKHAEQLAKFTEVMGQLEGQLMLEFERAGVDSMSCEAGTAYTSTTTSATVKHWSETLKYIQENEAWDLLEARVSKTAAVAIVEESGQPIPGVNITQA